MTDAPKFIPSSNDRLILKRSWDVADARHADVDTSTIAGALQWKELQDREREERMYLLTKQAAFRGIMGAYFAIVAISLLLWGVSILISNGTRT